MPLTAEQRRQINKANAQKSTGPKTDAGKEKVRQNALKHGMRAEVLILPDEDPAAIAARHQEWNDYYDPQSPAAQHLLNQCVRATLLADRVDRQHHDAISKQVREAQEEWDRAQIDQVEELKAIFGADPARATRLLRRSSLGCAWMIECWERLVEVLKERGAWGPMEFAEAFRLLGDLPGNGPPPQLEPRMLRALAEQQLGQLRDERDRLRSELEAPDRAGAPGRALILRDPAEARLFLRYHAEARCTFHRSWRDLVKVLEADAALAEAAGAIVPNGEVSPNKANAPSPDKVRPEDEARDASPNKANRAAGPEGPGAVGTPATPPASSPNKANPATEGPSPNKANPGTISRQDKDFGPVSGAVAAPSGGPELTPGEAIAPSASPNKANAPAPGAPRYAA